MSEDNFAYFLESLETLENLLHAETQAIAAHELDTIDAIMLQKDESLFNDWLQGKKENANKGIAEHTYLFHEGGLKQSLAQYADEQGMKLSYKAKLNYYIESPVIIKGEQKIDVLVKLLEAYPLSVSIADQTITIVSI